MSKSRLQSGAIVTSEYADAAAGEGMSGDSNPDGEVEDPLGILSWTQVY